MAVFGLCIQSLRIALNDVFENEQARRGDVQDFRVRSVHFTYDYDYYRRQRTRTI